MMHVDQGQHVLVVVNGDGSAARQATDSRLRTHKTPRNDYLLPSIKRPA
jgi:hypothetical protein